MTTANATFAVADWQETTWEGKPNHEAAVPKLTSAHVKLTYAGDIEGESAVEYLMYYAADGTTTVTGVERITGKLGGKQGSFVIQHTGNDSGGVTHSHFVVVPGSGTDELKGLRGEGSYTLQGHKERFPTTLEYEMGE